MQVGQTCARNIKELLNMVNKDICSFTHILDFGCGSGRVMRHFLDLPSSCHLYGTDIDHEAISWCERNLPRAEWGGNEDMPPLRYDSSRFDLIFALSVFTHLNEEMQFAWLGEMKRIVKPAGLLILSVHGMYSALGSHLSSREREVLAERGFLYTVGQTGRLKLNGLPDYYQTAYHTKAYIYKEWARYFRIIHYVERGVNSHQDAVILLNE